MSPSHLEKTPLRSKETQVGGDDSGAPSFYISSHLFPLIEAVLSDPDDAGRQANVAGPVNLSASKKDLVEHLMLQPKEGLFALSHVTRTPYKDREIQTPIHIHIDNLMEANQKMTSALALAEVRTESSYIV